MRSSREASANGRIKRKDRGGRQQGCERRGDDRRGRAEEQAEAPELARPEGARGLARADRAPLGDRDLRAAPDPATW